MSLVRYGWVMGLVLAMPAPSWAQSDATRAAARDLGADGVEDYQAGKYPSASEKLDRAFEILRVPTLGLWSARALAKTGKLVEASERYLAVTRLDPSKGEAAVQKQAQAEAASEREALQPRIPSLTLQVKGAEKNASITLDGVPLVSALLGVRQPANPGKHVAEAQQNGRRVSGEVSLAEGKHQVLVLDFAKAVVVPGAVAAPTSGKAAPPEPTQPADASSGGSRVPVGVWVGLAITGAGLATGGVTAGLAAGKKSDLNCPDDRCQPSQESEVNSYNRLLTISTIGFIAAGVGAATAGVFWFTRPREAERAAHVTPWVGLGSAGVRGAF